MILTGLAIQLLAIPFFVMKFDTIERRSVHSGAADDFDNGELFSADDDLTAYQKAKAISKRKDAEMSERINAIMEGK